MSAPTILLAELAALLGRPGPKGEAWLMRNHRRLAAELGLPARLPTGWAWPRRLIEIWIASPPCAAAPHGAGGMTSPRRAGRSGNPPAGAANENPAPPPPLPSPLCPPEPWRRRIAGEGEGGGKDAAAALACQPELAERRLVAAQHAFLTQRIMQR